MGDPGVKTTLWVSKLVRQLQECRGTHGLHNILLRELRDFAGECGGSITAAQLNKALLSDGACGLVDTLLTLDGCPPPTEIEVRYYGEPLLLVLPDLHYLLRIALCDPANAGAFTPVQSLPDGSGLACGPACTSKAAQAMERRFQELWRTDADGVRRGLENAYPDASVQQLVITGSLANDGAGVGPGRNSEFNLATYIAHIFHHSLAGTKKNLIPLAVYRKPKLGSPATPCMKMLVDAALQTIAGHILRHFYSASGPDGKPRGPLLIWGKDTHGVLPAKDAMGKDILYCINLCLLNNLMDKGESGRSVLCCLMRALE